MRGLPFPRWLQRPIANARSIESPIVFQRCADSTPEKDSLFVEDDGHKPISMLVLGPLHVDEDVTRAQVWNFRAQGGLDRAELR